MNIRTVRFLDAADADMEAGKAFSPRYQALLGNACRQALLGVA
jgi:hypothetical protein